MGRRRRRGLLCESKRGNQQKKQSRSRDPPWGLHGGKSGAINECYIHRADGTEAEPGETGDIVVALVDDEEATLKRLRRRGASIALEPANPAYETRIFGPDRVEIQGILVSLLRRY